MEESFAPRPIPGAAMRELSITGAVSPFFADNQPSFLRMPETDDLFLPLFSDKVTFDRFIARWPIPYDKLIQVEDGPEFLDSVPREIRVILNPREHEDGGGKVRFTELFR